MKMQILLLLSLDHSLMAEALSHDAWGMPGNIYALCSDRSVDHKCEKHAFIIVCRSKWVLIPAFIFPNRCDIVLITSNPESFKLLIKPCKLFSDQNSNTPWHEMTKFWSKSVKMLFNIPLEMFKTTTFLFAVGVTMDWKWLDSIFSVYIAD